MNSRKILINRQLIFKLWLTRFGIKYLKMSAQTTPIEVINWGMTTPTPLMVSSQTDHLIFAFREISQDWASTQSHSWIQWILWAFTLIGVLGPRHAAGLWGGWEDGEHPVDPWLSGDGELENDAYHFEIDLWRFWTWEALLKLNNTARFLAQSTSTFGLLKTHWHSVRMTLRIRSQNI